MKTRRSRLNAQSPNKPRLLQKRVGVFSRGYGIEIGISLAISQATPLIDAWLKTASIEPQGRAGVHSRVLSFPIPLSFIDLNV